MLNKKRGLHADESNAAAKRRLAPDAPPGSADASALYASLRTKTPSPAGASFSLSSSRQAGCVKSPVPIRSSPFRLAQRSSISGMQSRLVALEYLE